MNEAMNGGCAMLISDCVGSAKYLIDDGENGFIYKCKNVDEMARKLQTLIENREVRENFGSKSYEKIMNLWCARTAVERFLSLVKRINDGLCDNMYADGPCSQA